MILHKEVTWRSQAAGIMKTKTGTIVQVVKPKHMPDRGRFRKLYKRGVGNPRNHESYVVMVGNKLYWPRVSALNAAKCSAIQARIDELEHGVETLDRIVDCMDCVPI